MTDVFDSELNRLIGEDNLTEDGGGGWEAGVGLCCCRAPPWCGGRTGSPP